MKASRVAALGLVVGLCLLAPAPAALADGGWNPGVRVSVDGPDGWLPMWLVRVAAWLGWETPAEPAGAQPRAIFEQHGSCTDPSGNPIPCPTTNGDCGGHIDPNGACTP